MRASSWKHCLGLLLFLNSCLQSFAGGPESLLIVPQPQQATTGSGAVEVDSSITATVTSAVDLADTASDYLEQAFSRCVENTMTAQNSLTPWILSLHSQIEDQVTNVASATTTISSIQVTVNSSDPFPDLQIGIDESYSVTVSDKIYVEAPTVWGVLRGYETVAQLLNWDGSTFTIQSTPLRIDDWPRFPWRGMLVDTSRHFLPLDKVKQIVEGLAAMKMNVLHLHLTDAQSFPYVNPTFPELSGQGAFDSTSAVYTHDDLTEVISLAESLGVIVLPEFDMPGHTASWGIGYPDVTADCWDWLLAEDNTYPENDIPLNPANSTAFAIIDAIVEDAASLFPNRYFHVGGDEGCTVFLYLPIVPVNHDCWNNSAQLQDILQWMSDNNIADFEKLEDYFTLYAQNATSRQNKIPVVWEDAFYDYALLENTVVGAWRSKEVLAEIVQAGHPGILLYGYYQDMQAPLCTTSLECPECDVNWLWVWTAYDMYNNDPISGLGLTAAEEELVLGGEAATWGESVDVISWDQRGLTRSPSVAERLWSAESVDDRNWLEVRTDRFRCINVRRGISQAGPLYSEYCAMAEEAEVDEEDNNLTVAIIILSVICGLLMIVIAVLGFKMWHDNKKLKHVDPAKALLLSR